MDRRKSVVYEYSREIRCTSRVAAFRFLNMQEEVLVKHAEQADSILSKAGVKRYGIRLHGAGEYPSKLRDAEYPVELLYYQGFWDLVETRSVAVVGTRRPSADGMARAAKLVRPSVITQNRPYIIT